MVGRHRADRADAHGFDELDAEQPPRGARREDIAESGEKTAAAAALGPLRLAQREGRHREQERGDQPGRQREPRGGAARLVRVHRHLNAAEREQDAHGEARLAHRERTRALVRIRRELGAERHVGQRVEVEGRVEDEQRDADPRHEPAAARASSAPTRASRSRRSAAAARRAGTAGDGRGGRRSGRSSFRSAGR